MDATTPTDVSWLPGWAEVLIWVGVIIVVAAIGIWIVRRVEHRSVARVMREGETVRARQRGTAIGALTTGVIYLVVIAATVAVIAVIFGANSVAAISGSAFMLLVLGFAVQRLLADVVAGFFILFEGQFAVGDLVALESTVPMGVVERAGLRATVLRALNGDIIYVPNSQVKAAQRLPHRARDMEVGVLVADLAPVARAVADAADLVGPGGVRFASTPMVTRTDEIGDDLVWVRIRVDVMPGFEWMVSGLLVDVIRARCGDGLKGDPVVSDADRSVLRAYERTLREADGADDAGGSAPGQAQAP
ncbi:MAG: mechanosensitive ion channel family protein [Actinobacteria bacterium]|nr:mechanosensitive ion channel family protein [Actinomycetota bacterium]